MIAGIGTDLVDIRRLQASIDKLGDKFIQRILTPTEIEQWEAISNADRACAFVAKRFAAKEAAVKALGTGIGRGVSFQHFEVSNLPSGQPILNVSDELDHHFDGKVKWHLSLTDERDYAQAFVIVEAI